MLIPRAAGYSWNGNLALVTAEKNAGRLHSSIQILEFRLAARAMYQELRRLDTVGSARPQIVISLGHERFFDAKKANKKYFAIENFD